jgi:hypothetical protein
VEILKRIIKKILTDATTTLFELENGDVEMKEMELTQTNIDAITGLDFDEVFGPKVAPKKIKNTVEIDVDVLANMQKTIAMMEKWQKEQQHNQLENSRLADILNARRAGEDSGMTKADFMESEREQTRTQIYEDRKLRYSELTKREQADFIKKEGDKIRNCLKIYSNMTGSQIKPKSGADQEEFNNIVFGGGTK